MRVAAAQLNLVVGDLEGNAAALLAAYEQAEAAGCDLVAFPELALTGYPPEDLLLRPGVRGPGPRVARQDRGPHRARRRRSSGFPEADGDLYNSAAVLAHGAVQGIYRKHLLPNYAVFDEERYFEPWPTDGPLFVVGGVRVGVTVCEDAWSPSGPILTQAAAGAELIVNINASPYYAGRLREREAMLATRAADASVPILYVNLVGGQDELVFDGASMLLRRSAASSSRAARSSPRTCSSSTSTCDRVPPPALDPRAPRARRSPRCW